MDDLSRLLRDLHGKAITHHVTYYEDPDDGRANYVQVDAENLAADFGYHGTRWDLLKGYYRGRREPIEGLLKIIEEL